LGAFEYGVVARAARRTSGGRRAATSSPLRSHFSVTLFPALADVDKLEHVHPTPIGAVD
jgi:hypothetical protein